MRYGKARKTLKFLSIFKNEVLLIACVSGRDCWPGWLAGVAGDSGVGVRPARSDASTLGRWQ